MSDGKKEEEAAVKILDRKFSPLADGSYDVIVLGTGLKECMIAGMLSVFEGKKVLQLDKNEYYGSDTASLNLNLLYKKFRDADAEGPPAEWMAKLGRNPEYNVDLIPKFIMASGKLVDVLVHSGVNDYVDFKVVDGCYVYKKGKGIYKMPATGAEAATTSLMGFFQKRKFRSFLNWCFDYNMDGTNDIDIKTKTMEAIYSHFGLDGNTQDFVGHAMALHTDDSYIKLPAYETIKRIRLYGYSMSRYGKSPFIYPIWGIGGMAEGFSRKCAISGGIFMLNKKVDEILFDNSGRAVGVRCGEEAASAKMVIGEPTYFPAEKIRKTGTVVRSVCIVNHPIKDIAGGSAQIIIPGNQAGRVNDMYISVMSGEHKVVKKGNFLAIVSTKAETAKPLAEINAAVGLLGGCIERFDTVADTYEPVADGKADACFISKSYDTTNHFESVMDDVSSLYERITGKKLADLLAAKSSDEKK